MGNECIGARAACRVSVSTRRSGLGSVLRFECSSMPFHCPSLRPVSLRRFSRPLVERHVIQFVSCFESRATTYFARYVSLMDFAADCALIWDNALRYNASGSFVHNKAMALRRDAKHNIDAFQRKFPSIAAAVRCPTCQRMFSRESFDDHIDSCALESSTMHNDPTVNGIARSEITGADAGVGTKSHGSPHKVLSAESPEMAAMRRVALPHRTSPAQRLGKPTSRTRNETVASSSLFTSRGDGEIVDLCDESQNDGSTSQALCSSHSSGRVVLPAPICRSLSETATAGSLTQSLSDTENGASEQLPRHKLSTTLVLETQPILKPAIAQDSSQPCNSKIRAAKAEHDFRQGSSTPRLDSVLVSQMSPSLPFGLRSPPSPDLIAANQRTTISQMSPSIDLNSPPSQRIEFVRRMVSESNPHAGRSSQQDVRDTNAASKDSCGSVQAGSSTMHDLSQANQDAFLEPTQLGSQSPQFAERKAVPSPRSCQGSDGDTVLCKETQMTLQGFDSADEGEFGTPEEAPGRRVRGLKLTVQNLARVQEGSFGLARTSLDTAHRSLNDAKSFGSRSSSEESRTASVSSHDNASLHVGIGFHKPISGSESSDNGRSNHTSRQRRKAQRRQQQRRRDRQRDTLFRKRRTKAAHMPASRNSSSSSDSDASFEPTSNRRQQRLRGEPARKLDCARSKRQVTLGLKSTKPLCPSRRMPPKKCLPRSTSSVATQGLHAPTNTQDSQPGNGSTGWMCVESQSSTSQTPQAQPLSGKKRSQKNRRQGVLRSSGGGRQLLLRSFLSTVSAGSVSRSPSGGSRTGSVRNEAIQRKASVAAGTCSFIDDSADESESDCSLYEPPSHRKSRSTVRKAKPRITRQQRKRAASEVGTRESSKHRRTTQSKRFRRDTNGSGSSKERMEMALQSTGGAAKGINNEAPQQAVINHNFVPETQDSDILFPTTKSRRPPRQDGFTKGVACPSTIGSDGTDCIESDESGISSSSESDFNLASNRSPAPARLQDVDSPQHIVPRSDIHESRAAQLLRENSLAFRAVTRVARRSHADDCEISTQEQMRQGRYLDLNGLPAGAEVEEIQSTLMVSQWDDDDDDDEN